MKRQRGPYARRLWNVIIALSIVLLVGFAVAGYEINHLRTQVNGLQTQVTALHNDQATLSQLIAALSHKGQ